MQIRVSNKGRVTLSKALCRSLGILEGDLLDASIHGGRIVLTPHGKVGLRGRIVTDPVTTLPVLTAGFNAPRLSTKDVIEMLTNFP